MYAPMLAHVIEKKMKYVKFPAFVQPKLDGMRCLSDLDSPDLFSRTGKDIISVPRLRLLIWGYFGRIATDGELYCPNIDFEDIMSSCRQTANVIEDERVQYWIYDAYLPGLTFKMRTKILAEAYSHVPDRIRKRIVLCPTYKVLDMDEVNYYMKKFEDVGYEGLIFRNADSLYAEGTRSPDLLKMKRWLDMEVTVVGFEEGKGKHRGRLGAINCVFTNENMTGFNVSVGGGFTDEQREAIWWRQGEVINRQITIKYQNLTKYGIPRFPVFLRWREPE